MGWAAEGRRMRARVDSQCVIKANAQFWEQMLAMKLEAAPSADGIGLGAGHMVGSVGLTGAWRGRIEVRLASGLAYAATAAMMMQALDTVAEADALDAIREIANMIAGTIKSSLPRPCSMSVPEAAVEREGFRAGAVTAESLEVAFKHEAGEMMVRVGELECKAD
jgi:CheY-specific phosphatase CheX